MITIEEHEFKTPAGVVFRSTLLINNTEMISYECIAGKADSIAGLVLQVEKFHKAALESISNHLKEDTQ